jgi:hypothetical protein
MVSVQIGSSAAGANLVGQGQYLPFIRQRIRDFPLLIGILQNAIGHVAPEDILYENTVGHQLENVRFVGAGPGAVRRF